jgi:galactitol-specific phosphotransferase system IIB component
MLRIVVVCNSGEGTSVVLKDRLEKTIPGNEYGTTSLKEISKVAGDYDVVLTFQTLEPWVQKALKDANVQANVKTIEGFNQFAKDMFNEYLSK